MRRASAYVAACGAAGSVVSLWLPWFNRRVPVSLAPLAGAADRTTSGWGALEQLGIVLLVAAVVAAGWVAGRVPAVAMVVAGGLALMVEVAVTVDRISGGQAGQVPAATTSPAPGVLVALAGASAIVLAGIGTLLADVRRRTASAGTY